MDAVAESLARRPETKFVEKNDVFDPVLAPNDAQYGGQWHLLRVLAAQAWDLTQGDANVVIAIVDRGVDSDHREFAAKLVPGYKTYSREHQAPPTSTDTGPRGRASPARQRQWHRDRIDPRPVADYADPRHRRDGRATSAGSPTASCRPRITVPAC